MKELYREGNISIGVADDLQYYCAEWKTVKEGKGAGEERLANHRYLQSLWRAVRCAANLLAKRKAMADEVNTLQEFMQELLSFEDRLKAELKGL